MNCLLLSASLIELQESLNLQHTMITVCPNYIHESVLKHNKVELVLRSNKSRFPLTLKYTGTTGTLATAKKK